MNAWIYRTLISMYKPLTQFVLTVYTYQLSVLNTTECLP